jgi:hypothetical protein
MKHATTRAMQWKDICRAALIIGLIDNYSKDECLRLWHMIDKRVKSGQVTREKKGPAQSSRAFYRAKLGDLDEKRGELNVAATD